MGAITQEEFDAKTDFRIVTSKITRRMRYPAVLFFRNFKLKFHLFKASERLFFVQIL